MPKNGYVKKFFSDIPCKYCGILFTPDRKKQSFGSPVCATLDKSTSGMKYGTKCQCGDPKCISYVYCKNNLFKRLICRNHPLDRKKKNNNKPCEMCGKRIKPLYKMNQTKDSFEVCRECNENIFKMYEEED